VVTIIGLLRLHRIWLVSTHEWEKRRLKKKPKTERGIYQKEKSAVDFKVELLKNTKARRRFYRFFATALRFGKNRKTCATKCRLRGYNPCHRNVTLHHKNKCWQSGIQKYYNRLERRMRLRERTKHHVYDRLVSSPRIGRYKVEEHNWKFENNVPKWNILYRKYPLPHSLPLDV